MDHDEMDAWLEDHGRYTTWFGKRVWISNNASVTVESYEDDYVEHIFHIVKEKLFAHINKRNGRVGFGPY